MKIGHIEGDVLPLSEGKIIVKTSNGIGYEVVVGSYAPTSKVSLFISHIIREADQELYGFESINEKRLFEKLLTVKGVGPKSAFSLITMLGHQGVTEAILFENTAALSKAPGIGKKAASQILLDLNGKIDDLVLENKISKQAGSDKDAKPTVSNFYNDSIMALKSLGFDESMIVQKLNAIVREQNRELGTEEIVQEFLKGSH